VDRYRRRLARGEISTFEIPPSARKAA
jgi:hypothetical protein